MRLAMDRIKKHVPKLVTITLVVVSLVFAYLLYSRYVARPWTRDGQVRAVTVPIDPRVSGYLVEVAVKDNQFVRRGDLLFEIDPSSYQLAVDKAQVALDQAREDVEALEAALDGGWHWGMPAPAQLEVARRLQDAIPSMEELRICSTGTEATMYSGPSSLSRFPNTSGRMPKRSRNATTP